MVHGGEYTENPVGIAQPVGSDQPCLAVRQKPTMTIVCVVITPV
jgi:hypothetical protein